MPVYGDGRQVRDWIHVPTTAGGSTPPCAEGRPGEVYNFGGRCERFNIDVTRAVLRLTGKPEDA